MDPITIATLAAAAFSFITNTISVSRANRYNSPKKQLERVREAGLPQAYLYGGRVNQQSAVPQLSIDPDLGLVESKQLDLGKQKVDISADQLALAFQKLGIDYEKLGLDYRKQEVSEGQLAIDQALLELKSRLTDEQIEKLKQEIRYTKAGADIKTGEAQALGKIGPSGLSAQEEDIQLSLAIKSADLFIKRNEGKIKDILAQVEKQSFDEGLTMEQRRANLAKIQQQTVNLISQDAVLRQLIDVRKIDQEVNEAIGEALEDAKLRGDDWTVGVYSVLIKLLNKI